MCVYSGLLKARRVLSTDIPCQTKIQTVELYILYICRYIFRYIYNVCVVNGSFEYIFFKLKYDCSYYF